VAAGWALLAALALIGVGLSALVGLTASPAGQAAVAGQLTRQLDALVAGRLTLEAVEVLPDGGLALRGLRLHDPDGHLVLAAPRARISVQLARLPRRELSVAVGLDSPSLLLATEPDGGLSLARALAPAHPAPAAPGGPAAAPAAGSWTIALTGLRVRGGELRWQREDQDTAVAATGLEVDAAGTFGGAGSSLVLRVRASVAEPVAGPFALDAAARLQGDRLEVPLLDVALGATRLEALAEGDLRARAFRAAVTRLGVAAAGARRIAAPAAALAGDVAGTAYAESDGSVATAALEVPPAGAAAPGGTAFAAAALRLTPPLNALGFDVALAAFDPSRLLAQAPPGRLTVTARGAAAGHGLPDARGRLALEVAPSRLRDVEVGPITLAARAHGGLLEVLKLDARLPGLTVAARGRWREGGAVAGDLTLDAGDLSRAHRAVVAVTGLALPPLGGRLRARATLAGSSAAPAVSATLRAPSLRAGPLRAEAVALSLDAAGPLAAARLRLAARAARAEVEGTAARELELAAALAGEQASLSLTGSLPHLGPDPLAVTGAARLAADRRSAELRELSIRWPGKRFALARPATVTFTPPSVDRLELADGPRSIALSGGLRPRGALDARLDAVRLDLDLLTRGLVPPEAGVRGELSFEARASGTVRAPRVAVHLSLTDAGVRGLTGLQVLGELRWDGRGRLAGDARLRRTAGGALDLSADVPLPLGRARPDQPLALTADATAWPLEPLGQAAALATAVKGTLGGRLALSGTVAAPALEAALTLDEGAVNGVGPLAAAVALQGSKDGARLTAATRLAGAPLAELDARLPLPLADLLRRPEAALRALARAPVAGALEVPGVELAPLSGKLGLPQGLAGTVRGSFALDGTPHAPRGHGTLSVAGGAVAGYRDLAARVEVTAEAERTAFAVRASLGGVDALRAAGALGAPVERLTDRAALRETRLSLEATVPPVPLARAAGPALPLAGTVSASLAVKGTLARPEGRLVLGGKAVELEGRPLGDLDAVVRHAATTSTAEVSIRPAAGGVLSGNATLEAPLGLGADLAALRRAAATVRVTSDRVELGFLPALVPGLIRSASGQLTMDLAASGPLERLRPRGSVKLEGGSLAVAQLGEWSDLELVASLGEDVVEVSRLAARRRSGRVSGTLSVRDLGTPLATLAGRLVLQQLTVTRQGVDLVTLDFPLELEGKLGDQLLDVTVTLPAGTVRLPRRAARALQSLDGRDDIVEVEARAERARRLARTAPAAAAAAPGRGREIRCRVVAPGKLFVRSERPVVNLELKGDSTWRLAGAELTAEGTVEVVRGTVEPISGRVFHVERARVVFPGGAVNAGRLDVVARYDNPAAVVTVTVSGPLVKPSMQLSSVPSLDDAEIAMLIATGRSEINVNTSGVDTLSAQEAGAAVAGAVVGAAFSGLVSDKLPVDQISVDNSRVRAGKYVTDKLFVGYARRFDGKLEEGENENEVKAEYQIRPRWNFELRYGDAQAGDASLIWTKDY
jgi:translocation and assembly module TamB